MPDRILTVRVGRITRDTADVLAIDLRAAHGLELPPYAAGAHLDLHLPGGFLRSYSLAEAPHEAGLATDDRGRTTVERYRIGVKREAASRGGSRSVHERLREGDLLPVSVPRCTFPMPPGDEPLLLLAGGIGLTPLLAMAQQAVHDGRPVALHVFARHQAAVPFAAALGALERAAPVQWHLDDRLAERGWTAGDVLAGLLRRAGGGTGAGTGSRPPICVCGPAGFMAAVRTLAAQATPPWPAERVQWEYFAPPTVDGTDTDASETDQPFVLHLARQRVDVPVAADQTAVEALHDLGIDIPVSCQQGICGTCVVGWQAVSGAGEPVHRDHCLTDAERAHRLALCCVRSRQPDRPIVVDL
jgi:vanillate monooxygenase ferredoxin subunit